MVCLENPLATDLDILTGSAEVTVPDKPGDNYQVIGMYSDLLLHRWIPLICFLIVFGDSGNTSGRFKIIK
jgi:hypothetical protein